LERNFKMDQTEEEAIELVKNALIAGMHSDLSSGNSLRLCVIRKEGARELERFIPDFCQPSIKEQKYQHPPKTTTVLKSKQLKFDVVEAMEVDKK